ncbi:MAG: hypothetical protein Q7S26_04060 [bacterium]|nr:hypothetical protein [bacterium]
MEGLFNVLAKHPLAAILAEGSTSITKTNKPRSMRKWGNSARVIQWEHDLFGSVSINTKNFQLGNTEQDGPNTWARVYTDEQHPDSIEMRFITTLVGDEVSLLYAQGGMVTDRTGEEIPHFNVHVDWKEKNGNMIPHTRQRDKDNFDLVFLKTNGTFLQLQISLVTRKGDLWVCAQEVWAGQIVEVPAGHVATVGVTTHQVGEQFGAVAPLYPENAYPGADYLGTFPKMGPKLIDFAFKGVAFVPLAECAVAEWEPELPENMPENLAKNGWMKAVVLFYNLVTGFGRAIFEDGTTCFVHFSAIQDRNGTSVASKGHYPVLQPMSGVYLKRQATVGKRDPWQATAACVA